MPSAVDTQHGINMQDYQQHMMQTGVERKGLCETTYWTVVGGPGTLTSQSLSGGSFDFRPSSRKKSGKGMHSTDGFAPFMPISITVSRREKCVGGWRKHCSRQMDGISCQWIFPNVKQQYVREKGIY